MEPLASAKEVGLRALSAMANVVMSSGDFDFWKLEMASGCTGLPLEKCSVGRQGADKTASESSGLELDREAEGCDDDTFCGCKLLFEAQR